MFRPLATLVIASIACVKSPWRAMLAVLAVVSILGVYVDFLNTARHGQVDLRTRVVGARTMVLGENPYTFRWHADQPTTLLDRPQGLGDKWSRVTSTPTILYIHSWYASIHYRYQKYIWLFVQLFLYVGIGWIAFSRASNTFSKTAVVFAALMFSCSVFWRLHVERGQNYILFSFCSALFIWTLSKGTPIREFFSGTLLGVLVCFRPQYVLLGLPLLIYWKPRAIFGAIVGAILAAGTPILVHRSAWSEYYESMANYAKERSAPGPQEPKIDLQPELPAEIEGMRNLLSMAELPGSDTTLKAMLRRLEIGPVVFLAICPIAAAGWCFYIFRMKTGNVPLDFCTAKTLAMVLFVELALPSPRMPYSNVILLAIVAMIFATRMEDIAIRFWELSSLIFAWAFSIGFHGFFSAMFFSQSAILLWALFVPFQKSPTQGLEPLGRRYPE